MSIRPPRSIATRAHLKNRVTAISILTKNSVAATSMYFFRKIFYAQLAFSSIRCCLQFILLITQNRNTNNNCLHQLSIVVSKIEKLTSQLNMVSDFQDNVFEWDEHQQNTVKGAFFWLHMLLQIPGGLLAQKYGAKSIFGYSNGIVALLTCAIPLLAKLDFKALVLVRVVQGLIAGVSWPSMQAMTGKWIPPDERSRFVSAYLGTFTSVLSCFYFK